MRVSQLVNDFPEIVELDLNPVFATKKDAIAADVRIVVDFNHKPRPAPRPTEEIVAAMNRIMQPKAVAVIGASAEDGKIGKVLGAGDAVVAAVVDVDLKFGA